MEDKVLQRINELSVDFPDDDEIFEEMSAYFKFNSEKLTIRIIVLVQMATRLLSLHMDDSQISSIQWFIYDMAQYALETE